MSRVVVARADRPQIRKMLRVSASTWDAFCADCAARVGLATSSDAAAQAIRRDWDHEEKLWIRVFNAQGGELDALELVVADELLFVTDGAEPRSLYTREATPPPLDATGDLHTTSVDLEEGAAAKAVAAAKATKATKEEEREEEAMLPTGAGGARVPPWIANSRLAKRGRRKSRALYKWRGSLTFDPFCETVLSSNFGDSLGHFAVFDRAHVTVHTTEGSPALRVHFQAKTENVHPMVIHRRDQRASTKGGFADALQGTSTHASAPDEAVERAQTVGLSNHRSHGLVRFGCRLVTPKWSVRDAPVFFDGFMLALTHRTRPETFVETTERTPGRGTPIHTQVGCNNSIHTYQIETEPRTFAFPPTGPLDMSLRYIDNEEVTLTYQPSPDRFISVEVPANQKLVLKRAIVTPQTITHGRQRYTLNTKVFVREGDDPLTGARALGPHVDAAESAHPWVEMLDYEWGSHVLGSKRFREHNQRGGKSGSVPENNSRVRLRMRQRFYGPATITFYCVSGSVVLDGRLYEVSRKEKRRRSRTQRVRAQAAASSREQTLRELKSLYSVAIQMASMAPEEREQLIFGESDLHLAPEELAMHSARLIEVLEHLDDQQVNNLDEVASHAHETIGERLDDMLGSLPKRVRQSLTKSGTVKAVTRAYNYDPLSKRRQGRLSRAQRRVWRSRMWRRLTTLHLTPGWVPHPQCAACSFYRKQQEELMAADEEKERRRLRRKHAEARRRMAHTHTDACLRIADDPETPHPSSFLSLGDSCSGGTMSPALDAIWADGSSASMLPADPGSPVAPYTPRSLRASRLDAPWRRPDSPDITTTGSSAHLPSLGNLADQDAPRQGF